MTDTDGNKQIRARAEALLARMTLREKIGQLRQGLYGFQIYDIEDGEIRFTKAFEEEVAACGGLGTLYGLYRADPWSGRSYENGLAGEQAVRAYNRVQRYVLEHSRLGIPVMMSSECPHGHQALGGYLLPVNLAVGASFSPEAYGEAVAVCARQLRGMGVDLALVSALDILRDPRWGRSEECYSEDPYLASQLAKTMVERMQAEGVAVVAKHFCGQGETTGGVNASAARIGERELREIHLPAAKACCEAGVKGIMAAYNEIDGIFCHANRHLLQGILREEFGFGGVVMADGTAIDRMDVMTGDNVRSAAEALSAGVDIGLWDTGFSRLSEALKRGLVTEDAIDLAARRVLELKLSLGLFEKPYIGPDGARTAEFPETGFSCAYFYSDYSQSERLAAESVVLLKNRGNALPLDPGVEKIAVIGPNADDIYRQIGDYSPPLKAGEGETLLQALVGRAGVRKARFNGETDRREAAAVAGCEKERGIHFRSGSSQEGATALTGDAKEREIRFRSGSSQEGATTLARDAKEREIRFRSEADREEAAAGTRRKAEGKVSFSSGSDQEDATAYAGCAKERESRFSSGVALKETVAYAGCAKEREIRFNSGSDLAEVAALADWSDAVILALGGSSSRFEGAVFDRTGAAVKSDSMPMDCGEGVDSADIRLPGGQQELFDAVRRRGKRVITVVIAGRPYAIPEIAAETDALLYTFYPGPRGGAALADIIYGKISPSGRLPVSLPRSAGRLPAYYNYKKSYRAMCYHSGEDGALYAFGEGFGYSSFACRDQSLTVTPEGLLFACTVENTGEKRDAAVLQCYRSIRRSRVVPRVRELVAFRKVWLDAGEQMRVSIAVGQEFFRVFGPDGIWEEETGPIEFLLMDNGTLIWKEEVTCI